MNLHRTVTALSLLAVLATSNGCVESQAVNRGVPFETQELDGCLAIVIDMSGSFSIKWDDKAYDLFIEMSEAYFAEAMGTENRLIISQLSGNGRVILFEGQPSDLQKRFNSPKELIGFLKQNSDASRSRVFDSVSSTIEYVASMSGITDRTRLMTVVLSDLRDSEPDQSVRKASGRNMVDALSRYQKLGGGLALYYVANEETPRWEKILHEAGFEAGHFIIENELTTNPQLPRFD